MPQNPRKIRQMVITAGVKPPIYAGMLYTVAAGVATLVGKTQYISKGVSGSWPGPGWHMMPGIEELPPEEDKSHEQPGQQPQRPVRPPARGSNF
jgi:hypothetical protein